MSDEATVHFVPLVPTMSTRRRHVAENCGKRQVPLTIGLPVPQDSKQVYASGRLRGQQTHNIATPTYIIAGTPMRVARTDSRGTPARVALFSYGGVCGASQTGPLYDHANHPPARRSLCANSHLYSIFVVNE
jgi:hypothetical protein